MSTIEEELEADAAFLRGMAERMRTSDLEDVELENKFNTIADKLGTMSAAMFVPRIQLEKRAEKRAAEWIETCLNTEFEAHEEIHLFLWLIQLRLQQSANKAMLGQGLAGLGIGVAGALFGGGGKGKAPIDGEDK
jgi:hypothetical protein